MLFSSILAVAGAVAVQAANQGFNYGSTFTDGSVKVQADFENEFNRAKNLPGTSGFTSARLYTMIQGGTASTVSSAIPAAINTKTGLLLGLWASAGSDSFNNEVTALVNAINQYGTAFTSLIEGISVGSEDLYRNSPTGIINKSGYGANPDDLVKYIQQVRSAISGTSASGKSIGHVDTWTAWVNGSNAAVINAVDWLGVDGYPYFQNTQSNGIENGASLFFDSYNATVGVATGKDVWITETGWPVSGPTENLAVASTENAETYWQDVACRVLGNINTYWYTLQDAYPTTPAPSFGIVGTDLNSAPLYDLTCKNGNSASSSSSSSSAVSSSTSAAVSSTASSATQPSTAAASSTVSIVTAPGAESSASSSGAASAPVSSTNAQSSSAKASSTVSTVVASSESVSGVQTFTTYSTTLITITACPSSCSTTATASGSASVPASGSASASASASKASTTSVVAPSSSTSSSATPSGSSCPANLNGAYEYPHLIVPVDSANPSKAYGTSYNGTISSTVSTIFNFDIPASDAGKTCSLVFLLPQKSQLETSDYTFNGQGGLKITGLSSPATEQTTYSSVPAANSLTGSIPSVSAGNSYVVLTESCPAGQRVGFEFSSTGGLELNFFEDYNPSPLGVYITVC